MIALVNNTKGKIKVLQYFDKRPLARLPAGAFYVQVKNKSVFGAANLKQTVVKQQYPKWKVDILDPEQKQQFKDWLKAEDYNSIFRLHNKLELSKLKYCCNRHKSICAEQIKKL